MCDSQWDVPLKVCVTHNGMFHLRYVWLTQWDIPLTSLWYNCTLVTYSVLVYNIEQHWNWWILVEKWPSGKTFFFGKIIISKMIYLVKLKIFQTCQNMIYLDDISYFVVEYCSLHSYFDCILSGVRLIWICRLQNLTWNGIIHIYLWYHFK